MGNRLSFPICTSTQRKSKCISEMVSARLKLDNKWTDLHACSMDGAAQQKDYSLLCAAAAASLGKKAITHHLLIFFLRIHYTCLQPRGQTKTPVPDSTGQCGFVKKKKKKSATKQIFHQATLKQAFSSYVFFLPVHVRERGEINFHRIRLPGENDCFF